MEKQKNHPAESSRDGKIEELLQHIPDDFFLQRKKKLLLPTLILKPRMS